MVSASGSWSLERLVCDLLLWTSMKTKGLSLRFRCPLHKASLQNLNMFRIRKELKSSALTWSCSNLSRLLPGLQCLLSPTTNTSGMKLARGYRSNVEFSLWLTEWVWGNASKGEETWLYCRRIPSWVWVLSSKRANPKGAIRRMTLSQCKFTSRVYRQLCYKNCDVQWLLQARTALNPLCIFI